MEDKGLWRSVVRDRELPPGGGEGSAEGDRLVRATKITAVNSVQKVLQKIRLKRTQMGRRWGQVEERSWNLGCGNKPSHDHSSLVSGSEVPRRCGTQGAVCAGTLAMPQGLCEGPTVSSRPRLGPPPGHGTDLSAEATQGDTLYLQNRTMGSTTKGFLTSRHAVPFSVASLIFIHRPDPCLPSPSRERKTRS